MVGKERRVSERSLENLKLGAESRRQGKLRHNFTILPETVQWLKATGNASDAIDALVEAARTGGLISSNTHAQNEQESLQSNDVYKQEIKNLKRGLEETQLELQETRSQLVEAAKDRKQLAALKAEKEQLEQQAAELRDYAQKVSCQLPALEDEIDLLRSQMEHLENQPTVGKKSVASAEIIKLLEQAITPKSKGGSYLANNASGLKLVIEQALKQLTAATVISIENPTFQDQSPPDPIIYFPGSDRASGS